MAFTTFVAFIRRLGWSFYVAFRVFVAFMGHWGGILLAFTVLVSVYWALGLNVLCRLRCLYCLWSVLGDVCEFHSVCSVYEAFGPVIFVAFRVFVAFMGHWGWTLVAFTALVVFMGRWGWTFVALQHL